MLSRNLVGLSPPIMAKIKSLGTVSFTSLVRAFIKTTSPSRISLMEVPKLGFDFSFVYALIDL
jgi:hypothetical protein